MSTRPSDSEFLQWIQNDQNKSKVQNALIAHPDLVNKKYLVSFSQTYFVIINNSNFNFLISVNGLICNY